MRLQFLLLILTLIAPSTGIAGAFHWIPVGPKSGNETCRPYNFNHPGAVAVGQRGNIYIANEQGPKAIEELTVGGHLNTILSRTIVGGKTKGLRGISMAIGPHDELYIAVKHSGVVYRVFRNGHLTLIAGKPGITKYINGAENKARLDAPRSIAVGPRGNIFVADSQTVREIERNGIIRTVAGIQNAKFNLEAYPFPQFDGKGTQAIFLSASAIAVDKKGDIYVADNYTGQIDQQAADLGIVRKVTSRGVVSTLAGAWNTMGGSLDGNGENALFNSIVGIALDPKGGLYTLSDDARLRHVSGDGRVVTIYHDKNQNLREHNLISPSAIAVSKSKSIYITSSYDLRRLGDMKTAFWLNRFKNGKMTVLCRPVNSAAVNARAEAQN